MPKKNNSDGAANWRARGEWGSSNGGRASDNEKGGCGLALMMLPFTVIGMLVQILFAEVIWSGGKKGGACDSFARSSGKLGLFIVIGMVGIAYAATEYLS